MMKQWQQGEREREHEWKSSAPLKFWYLPVLPLDPVNGRKRRPDMFG
jgi:hypothetical protein